MLDISFSELLLCFVVALVVLGPERLPGIARGIGRWTGRARSYMRNLSSELDRESSVAEFRRQMGDAKRILDEESISMKKSFDEVAQTGRNLVEGKTPPPPAADLAATAPASPETPPPASVPTAPSPPSAPAPAAAPKHEPLHHDPYV